MRCTVTELSTNTGLIIKTCFSKEKLIKKFERTPSFQLTPLFLSIFFHDPPFCPNFKNKNPLPLIWGGRKLWVGQIHFSNFEDGHSPDKKNVRRCFLRRILGWLLLEVIQVVTESVKIRNCEVLGKCSRWNLNSQKFHQWDQKHYIFTFLRTNSIAGRLDHTIRFSSPTK